MKAARSREIPAAGGRPGKPEVVPDRTWKVPYLQEFVRSANGARVASRNDPALAPNRRQFGGVHHDPWEGQELDCRICRRTEFAHPTR